jgi:putative aldouronate transport system permease protein
MLLPSLIGFLVFQYIPIINGAFIGFVQYDLVDGMWSSPFVGFKYFAAFLKDPFFFRLIRNTFLLGFYGLIWGFPAPIVLALMINEIRRERFKKIVQTLTYLPYFISIVVVIGIMYNLLGYQGVINTLLSRFGAGPVNFIGSPSWFRFLYIGSGIWQGAGWSSIIYLAALTGIDAELYEAARIDGANRWRQMVHISLPGIIPTIRVLLILSIGGMIGIGFEKVYLMYSPPVYEVADVISTYVYRRGIEGLDYSYGGAVSLFNSAISLLLLFIANRASRKVSGEGIW